MTDRLLTEIRDQLGRLTALVAVSATSKLPRRDQILLLSQAGFAPKEIAELTGTTANTVSVELYKLRQGRKGKPKELAREKEVIDES